MTNDNNQSKDANPQVVTYGRIPTPKKNGIVNLYLGRLGLGTFFAFSVSLSIMFFFIGINLGSSGIYRIWVDSSINCEENKNSEGNVPVSCPLKNLLLTADASGAYGVGLSDIKEIMNNNSAYIEDLYTNYHDLNSKQLSFNSLRNEVIECKKTSGKALLYLKDILMVARRNCT